MFDKALITAPDHPFILNSKGVALYGLERYQEAIEYYDKALASQPNDVKVLYNKGLALGDLGRYQESYRVL